jgi:hypothetical protein
LTSAPTLQSLEKVLESFLERAVAAKGARLEIIEGISRLDDLARASRQDRDIVDNIGSWFADHSDWLTSEGLRPGDLDRVDQILERISQGLSEGGDTSPAAVKIRSELQHWRTTARSTSQRLVLKRGPEAEVIAEDDTVAAFDRLLSRMQQTFQRLSESKKHLLSVLEEALLSARTRNNRDALLLSAVTIYYLKLNNYKVDPFVRRLKEAETGFRQERPHA